VRKFVLLGVGLATLFASDTDSTDKEAKFIGARGKYWAFQRVVRPAVPTVSGAWVRTPIDAFILDALTAKNIGIWVVALSPGFTEQQLEHEYRMLCYDPPNWTKYLGHSRRPY